MKFILTFLIVITCLVTSAHSQQMEDVVYLKNGSIIRGLVMEQYPESNLKIQTKDGSLFVYEMSEVEKIIKETSTDGYKQIRHESNLNLPIGNDGFREGNFYTGLKVGYGDWGDATYGLSMELGVSRQFGIALDVAYSDVKSGFSSGEFYGGLLGLSYHFSPGEKLDTYSKIGIGYFHFSSSKLGTSGVGYGVQAGLNYFVTRGLSVSASAGWPFYLSAGPTFRF